MNILKVHLRKVLLLLLGGTLCVVLGQIPAEPPHKWRVKPGTTEWARLEGQAEKVAVLAISRSEAAALSTKDLVATCMDYPLLASILFFDDRTDGVDFLYENFYGFKELLGRPRVGEHLVAYYRSTSIKSMLLSQCLDHLFLDRRFMDILSASDRVNLCKASLRKIHDLRKMRKVASQPEVLAARLAMKLMAEKGVTLSHRGRIFTVNELPSNSAAFLREESVPGYLDSVLQFCLDTGNN